DDHTSKKYAFINLQQGTYYSGKIDSTCSVFCFRKSAGDVGERVLRSTPDWGETAINGDHLWVPTSVSGRFLLRWGLGLYEFELLIMQAKHGSRMKCSACNVIAHHNCINLLVDRVKFTCKPTFKDVGVRQYREQTSIQHHWVHRRSEKGKCRHCGKSFQSKLSFSSKEIVAISCSWCKAAYHNKESCFNIQRIGEECNLGVHSSIVVPPSWIVKLPRKGSFKSSLRKSPKKEPPVKRKIEISTFVCFLFQDKEQKFFAIKPIPSTNVTPVIVFINPKSGGNQGLKLLQKFQWLLNPRQVFDLTLGGPKLGLELFKKVPNLRVLACGGDGTVGWILSVIDQIGISPAPAVGVLPLGTGNDLARALGWGGETVASFLRMRDGGNWRALGRSLGNAKVKREVPVSALRVTEAADIVRLKKNFFPYNTKKGSSSRYGVAEAEQIGLLRALFPTPTAPHLSSTDSTLILGKPSRPFNTGTGLYLEGNAAKFFTRPAYQQSSRLRFSFRCNGNTKGREVMFEEGSGSCSAAVRTETTPLVWVPGHSGDEMADELARHESEGYTDEPISKILSNISNSDTVALDRWSLDVEKNTNADPNEEGKENLPLNVVNNYYSLGVDAHIALEFHEAREAHPERFNSRLRNKMFYGQMGGKDLLKRKWKDLADFVTLECDGQNITNKLKELRVHAIVFLNIPSYGGGTRPWNRSMGTSEPSTEDGLIEVVGLTTYQLPLLQAGGHGTCITQCKSAKIITSKTIPMQVDGEACKLKPSVITLTHLNRATMLAKRKCGKLMPAQTALDNLKINVHKISMADYEQHHYDKDLLAQAAIGIGNLEVNPISDLEQVRAQINKLMEDNKDQTKIYSDWCFVDSCTAERFFRIDKAQENLHFVSDIAFDNLYILECGGGTLPQTPEDETANPSPSSNHQGPYIIPEMRISDEGSLDSPSDQPPMSPKVLQSPEDYPTIEEVPVKDQNGDKQIARVSPDAALKMRSKIYIVIIGLEDEETSSHVLTECPAIARVRERHFGSSVLNPEDVKRIQPRYAPLPKSITERLFGLNQESYSAYSHLPERPNESLIKAAKTGDLKMAATFRLDDVGGDGIGGERPSPAGIYVANKGSSRSYYASLCSSLRSRGDCEIFNQLCTLVTQYKGFQFGSNSSTQGSCLQMEEYLLHAGSRGADLDATDHRGLTPRLLALQCDENEMAAYLESKYTI
ncbi:hypothetical protein NQ317_006707, partial [Molorchus minor]